MVWWGVLLVALASAVVGAAVSFFVARYLFKRQVEKNPPITANQIRAMYRQMGRSASERDVQKVIKSMNKAR